MITWKKVQTGIFEAYVDGVKTPYGVENGSLGFSGKDTPNFYVPLRNGNSMLKPGFGISLNAAKQVVEMKLEKS